MAKKATAKSTKSKSKSSSNKSSPRQEIITVKTGALSTDVGPRVIAELDKSYTQEVKLAEQAQALLQKRYDILSSLTLAVAKAFKADDSIDRTAVFGDDKKAMNRLNNQLGLALGFREALEVNGRQVIGYAKAVQKYFPSGKDNKTTEAFKRKSTLRSNFLHQLKKCVVAANAIVDNDLKAEHDTESGTLMISGPAVKAKYGVPSVILNEKQTIGEGENKTKLKAKPSFTSLGEIAAAKAGVAVTRRIDSRKTVEKKAENAEDAFLQLCEMLTRSIKRRASEDGFTDKEVAALRKVSTEIEQSGALDEKEAA